LQNELQNSERNHQLLIDVDSEMDQDDETPPNKMDRSRDGRFKKGQSGNPGGRPKIFTEVKQAAREHTEAALQTLLAVVNNEKASAAARVAELRIRRARYIPKRRMIAQTITNTITPYFTQDHKLATMVLRGVGSTSNGNLLFMGLVQLDAVGAAAVYRQCQSCHELCRTM
jgi:hypothetical protein